MKVRRITVEQWEAIRDVLRLKRIDQRRFVARFGATRPGEIAASDLLDVLRLAMNPTDDLRLQPKETTS